MADTNAEKNIARYRLPDYDYDGSRFCLAQLRLYSPDNQATQEKVDDLLDSVTGMQSEISFRQACSIGGCTLKITVSPETGKVVSGECKAAEYCLKTAFGAVGQASTTEEGRELHSEIVSSLEFLAGRESAGNFCPRLNCGLSAGVSIDGVPGTAGDCAAESPCQQPQLPLEPY